MTSIKTETSNTNNEKYIYFKFEVLFKHNLFIICGTQGLCTTYMCTKLFVYHILSRLGGVYKVCYDHLAHVVVCWLFNMFGFP